MWATTSTRAAGEDSIYGLLSIVSLPSAYLRSRLSRVRVRVTDDSIEVLLARWEKILGLMKDIRVPLGDVSDVRVVEDPIR